MEKLLSIISIPFQLGGKQEASRKFNNRRTVVNRPQVKSTVVSRPRSGRLMTVLMSVTAVFTLGLFFSYLYTVNAYANSGYHIKQMETRIAEKDTKYKKMLVERSEANSMASVDEAVQSGAFVPVNASELLFVPSSHISQK